MGLFGEVLGYGLWGRWCRSHPLVGCAHLCGKGVLNVAREVIEKLIDDLDGSPAVDTVAFALDGTSYEIDLSKRNAAAFRKAFDRYVKAAQRQDGTRSAPRRRTVKAAPKGKAKRDFDLTQLREWAAANDVVVPSRGRIPQAVVEQYKADGGR